MSDTIWTHRRLLGVSLTLPVLFVILYLGSGEGVLGYAYHTGYAVCHQISVRTYIFGELTMPLCARCTGQYLGLVLTISFIWARGRLRASLFPDRWLLVLLIGFIGLWAMDGVNSYITLIWGSPLLYPPHNLLRLSTGVLQGIAVGLLLIPFVNRVLWQQPDPIRILDQGRAFAALLCFALLLILSVHSMWPPLFYLLSFMSVVGVWLMLTVVGMLVAVLALSLENRFSQTREVIILGLPGLAFAAIMIGGMNLLRWVFEQYFPLPPPLR